MVILRCHHFLFNDLLIYYHSIILGSERWNNMKLLENKVAIITGGTRSIGFATVEAFLKQGAKVAMCGSRQETVDKALEKLSEYSDSLMGICPKLDDAESVGAAFDEVVAHFGKVDILINNAGLAASGPTYNFDDDTFDRIIAI